MRRGDGVWVIALVAGCGASNDAPAQAPASRPSARAVPNGSADDPRSNDAERARARALGAAAGAWRRGHGGACPTVKEILDAYALPSGGALDASGAPFTVECGDAEVRVFASGHALADAQPWTAVVPTIPNDPPLGPPATTPSVPSQRAEDVIRSLVETRARSCYRQALKRDPNQAGEIHGTITVNGDGSVKSVVIDKQATTLTDPELIECLTTAMKASRQSPSGDVRTVKF